MNKIDLKRLIESIVKEIVQSEITPMERGGGIQANDNTTGMYGKDKGENSYFIKDKKFPYLWHLKGDEMGGSGGEDNGDEDSINKMATDAENIDSGDSGSETPIDTLTDQNQEPTP